MDDLLNFIIKEIVDSPDSLDVGKDEDDFSITYNLDMSPTDLGKVIGKGGRTINSITNIMNLTSFKKNNEKKRIVLRIKENI